MNIVDNIVNTYAWIKLTNTSSTNMKIENRSEITAVPPAAAYPNAAKMKINPVSVMTIM